jgi:hypothetical protein
VRHYTNASMIVREDYDFDEGLFSGFDLQKRQYDKTSWNYELDENGSPGAMIRGTTRAASGI